MTNEGLGKSLFHCVSLGKDTLVPTLHVSICEMQMTPTC